jgi:hypothetical protein
MYALFFTKSNRANKITSKHASSTVYTNARQIQNHRMEDTKAVKVSQYHAIFKNKIMFLIKNIPKMCRNLKATATDSSKENYNV